jgi:hypothetical protein
MQSRRACMHPAQFKKKLLDTSQQLRKMFDGFEQEVV